MANGVNIYELLHAFWEKNEYEPFSVSEIAMFFFLLDRANSRHWQMPVRCPTSVVCQSLKISKQTVVTSRSKLQSRGLISFSEGKGNSSTPYYSIITDTSHWTDGLTDTFTDNLTDSLTDGLTTLNIEDNKNQNKDIKSSNVKGQSKLLSLDELEKIFISDEDWKEEIIESIPALTPDELNRQISFFFQRLRLNGEDKREEKDCRNYKLLHQANDIYKFLVVNYQRGYSSSLRYARCCCVCPVRCRMWLRKCEPRLCGSWFSA